MSDTERFLSSVRSRIALGGAVEDLQRGLALGALGALAGLTVRAVGLIDFDPLYAPLAGCGIALACPLVGMAFRRLDTRKVAAVADRQLGLEERLSTAVWCEATAEGRDAPLEALVRSDAVQSAALCPRRTLARAFRPRFLRKPVLVALAASLAAGIVAFQQPIAAATETREQTAERRAQEDRSAAVARQLEAAAKSLEKAAGERKLAELQKTAKTVSETAEKIKATPPARDPMLSKLNDLRDAVKADARRLAGHDGDLEGAKADATDKALRDLLEQMAQAGLESIQSDLSELAKRLENGENGAAPPSLAEVQAMASRIDALRRAIERAEKEGAGGELREKLQSLANRELLDKISQKLREIAQRMQQGESYESLQAEESSEWSDMSEMSREELEELLKQLEQLAAMEDLEQLLQRAGQSTAGGRKLRLGGSGGT